jgi:NAD+ kinase
MQSLKIPPKCGIAIVYRPETAEAYETALLLTSWLCEKSFKVFTAPKQKVLPKTKLMKSVSEFKSIQLIIVLGGDGTYLRAVRLLNGFHVPVLGVNLGSLGFLTPIRKDELFAFLERTVEGKNHQILARSMMSLELKSKNKIHEKWLALNDVVIERGPSSHLIDLKINLEDHFVSNIKADALIIATPTGSTAYNLAAGGPIVYPSSKVFIATSVAPHSLTNRPILFPDSMKLEISLHGQCMSANIIADGEKRGQLNRNEVLTIHRHKENHWMIQPKGQNYFELLREKLSFGERN